MTKKPEKLNEPGYNRLFVIGIDADGKPRGARFQEPNDHVADAALDMGLTLILPSSDQTAELGMKLPEGRLYKTGKTFIPNISRDLFDSFAEVLANPDESTKLMKLGTRCISPHPEYALQGPATIAPISPTHPGLPRSWDELDVGHMVLIHEDAESGWWEAVILKRDDEVLTLRFRDYPKQPTFLRHTSAVALVNPGPVAP